MTTPKHLNSLSEFLLQAQTQYLIFDLGRGLKKIDNQVFFEWENQQAPCAYPRREHAWFCISFWNQQLSQDRYIWFVKLPVDENGLMIQASRNQFLEIIVTALGASLEHTSNSDAQLPENPYVFQPSQQQLADCNAHIRKYINDVSRDNQQAEGYLQAPSVAPWQSLSVQNMADYVCQIENSETCAKQAVLAQNLMQYPVPVLNCIFASLESTYVNQVLANAIMAFHAQTSEHTMQALSLRAISHHRSSDDKVMQYIADLINNQGINNVEVAVVIAGRYWEVLTDNDLQLSYMHQVCELDGSFELFKAIYADLVKIPSCRDNTLGLLRNPHRSELVAKGIGSLFA